MIVNKVRHTPDTTDKPRIYIPEVTDASGHPWFVIDFFVQNRKTAYAREILNSYGRPMAHITADGMLYVKDKINGHHSTSTGRIFKYTKKGLLQAVRLAYLMTQETVAERKVRLEMEKKIQLKLVQRRNIAREIKIKNEERIRDGK